MKKIFCGMMAALLAVGSVFFCACSKSTGSFGYTQEGKDILRVGMECDYAPFNWTQTNTDNGAIPILDQNGYYAAGYDVEIAKRIAKELDREAVAVKLEWDGLLPALESGTIDVIIANMSPTAERKEKVDFTDFYYENDVVVVVKKDGEYAQAKNIRDFNGATLIAQKGTTNVDMLDQIEGVTKSTPLEKLAEIRAALVSGLVDGYVAEKCEASGFTAANDAYMYVDFEENGGFTYDPNEVNASIAVKKGYEKYVDKINQALQKISDEERDQLMAQATKNQPSEE
ncbi:MAG: transporter substrate-binding domain-containing protein [Clostridiales bacterium]|nr:transporter substrate-binding domain-containing protein [Clostridiales bacterium]